MDLGVGGMRTSVAIVVGHPIQYFSPLFDEIARDESLKLVVLYGTDKALVPATDAAFGRVIKWDLDLVSGHRHSVFFRKNRAWMLSEKCRWIRHLVRSDIAIVHGYADPLCVLAISIRLATRRPYLLRSDSTVRTKRPFWHPREVWVRIISTGAAGALSSGTLNARIQANNGVPKTFPVPFVVDVDRFRHAIEQNPQRVAEIRSDLGLGTRSDVVVYSGKLVAHKNVADICEAVARMREVHRRDVELLVIGDGELRDDLEKNYSTRGSIFAGFVNQSELPAHLAVGKALVLASSYEPWGLSANEGLACRLVPVLSHVVGSLPDLARYGALEFRLGDIDDLIAALGRAISMYDSPEQTKRTNSYMNEYSIPAAAQATAAAIRALSDGRSTGSTVSSTY